MASSTQDVVQTLIDSFSQGQKNTSPYCHWFLKDCIPQDTLDELIALPIKAPDLGGESGTREQHNATRTYFDVENRTRFHSCRIFSEAFQDRRTIKAVENIFGAELKGTYLRIEYVLDTGGFWLEPHTDLGVKNFTMLFYISDDKKHFELGTDLYDDQKNHAGRAPFRSNASLVFVPASNTFHGFEPRTINGIRKSIIINYVSDEWRAREQLAFPDTPIGFSTDQIHTDTPR